MFFSTTEAKLFDIVHCVSDAADLVNPALGSHHIRVAFAAGSIAQEMGLPDEEISDIVLAAMLHDIGASMAGRALDARLVDLLERSIGEIDGARAEAQDTAVTRFERLRARARETELRTGRLAS